MPRVVTILQARMGSSRLPGKSLRPMAGKPMVQWCLERLAMMTRSDALILATSRLAQDDPLAEAVRAMGFLVFRGSESDVLDRYYHCALEAEADRIVRATGDNPFVDAAEADRLIDFLERENLDYACGATAAPNGYPVGVSVEVMGMDALARSWREGHAPHHREHVNEYVLEHPEIFRQARLEAPVPLRAPGMSLTVDTLEQFQHAEDQIRNYRATGFAPPVPVAWIVERSRLAPSHGEPT